MAQSALQKNPHDANALVTLSIVEWAYGRLNPAASAAEKAVAADDGSAAAHAQLVNILGAKLASNKTGTMEKLSLSRQFRKEADRTLQLDPNNLFAHEALARYYWYAPSIGGGDKTKATQIVDRIVRLDSTRGYALKAELDAANADRAKGQAAILPDWKQAVTAAPESYAAHVGLSNCLLNEGTDHLRAAEDEARKALELDPSRIAAYRLLATIYATNQQWENLDATLKQARSAVPDDLGAEFAAAQAILDHKIQSQYPRAEEYLRHYLTQPAEGLEPTQATAHWRLGLVLEQESRRTTALNEFQTAINLDSSLDGAKKDLRRLQ